MKQRSPLFLGTLLLALISCSSSDDKKITDGVDGFLKTYNRNFRTTPRAGLTQSLTQLLDQAVAAENTSREQIRQSDHPTDKPNLIEGEIFASVYEGYDRYELMKVVRKGDEVLVPVNFTNSTYKFNWQDTFVLKNEQGWKIDNVLFNAKDKPRTYSGTRALINEFLKVTAP